MCLSDLSGHDRYVPELRDYVPKEMSHHLRKKRASSCFGAHEDVARVLDG